MFVSDGFTTKEASADVLEYTASKSISDDGSAAKSKFADVLKSRASKSSTSDNNDDYVIEELMLLLLVKLLADVLKFRASKFSVQELDIISFWGGSE